MENIMIILYLLVFVIAFCIVWWYIFVDNKSKSLYFWMFLLSGVSAFALFVVSSRNYNKALVINILFSIVVGFLVAGITDYINEHNFKKRFYPLQIMAYRDIQKFVSNIIALWTEMYVQSTKDRKVIPVKELFSRDVVNNILLTLNIEGKPNHSTYTTWGKYLEFEIDKISKLGNNILDRYIMFIDESVSQNIYFLVNESLMFIYLKMVKSTQDSDRDNNVNIPPILGNYCLPYLVKDCEIIQKLIDWCNFQRENLISKDSNAMLHKVKDKIVIINPDSPPTSIYNNENEESYSHKIQWNIYKDKNYVQSMHRRIIKTEDIENLK